MLTFLALILLGYLLGSIPSGYWLVKAMKGIDVRTIGSGSTGATNVLRAAGKPAAITVLVLDALKGVMAVLLAQSFDSSMLLHGESLGIFHLTAPFAALAAMIGHSKSIFLKFQGGKSAAVALGTLLAMNYLVGSGVFAIWTLLVLVTRYVSVASMVAGLCSIVLMFALHNPASYVVYCCAGATYVLIRHQSNIGRLRAGTEPKIGQKPANQEAVPAASESSTGQINS